MIVVNNEEHGHLIMDECMGTFTPGLDSVISRTVDGQLVGGVVYTAHTGRSCQMHQWGRDKHWINRDLLWVAFHYPFVQLEYDCIVVLVRASHEKTINLNGKFGFKKVAHIKAVYPGDDCVVMQLMKEECKWLNLKPRNTAFRGGY